ncbi:MAG TPA: heavy-metal-associated domain-containing protein [candidate division Zixibacteria bacterium]|nr:heavy-metal-associated domain-containing protein [candidate division Zixibacteria bacterium]
MQGALSKIEGVRSADINLEEQRAVVKHTPETVKPEQLIKVIEEAGFKAKEENAQKEAD